MLLCDKESIKTLNVNDFEVLSYKPIPIGEEWRIDVVNELVGVRSQDAELPGFTSEDIKEMLNFVCTS